MGKAYRERNEFLDNKKPRHLIGGVFWLITYFAAFLRRRRFGAAFFAAFLRRRFGAAFAAFLRRRRFGAALAAAFLRRRFGAAFAAFLRRFAAT